MVKTKDLIDDELFNYLCTIRRKVHEWPEPAFEEYIVLLLALAPHVQPGFLDATIKEALKDATDFPEIGGTRDNEKRVFLPTGENRGRLVPATWAEWVPMEGWEEAGTR